MNNKMARLQRPVIATLCAGVLLAATPLAAQTIPRGAERRAFPQDGAPGLAEPRFAPSETPRFELPPLPPPREGGLGTSPGILVRRIEIAGNTVLTSAELAEIAAGYEGREVTLEELFRLKDELTLAYVEKGYVNSGAVLPDQEVVDGVVRIEIVEGGLETIKITGTDRLDADFLARRIRLGADRPLDVNALQERLQLLLLEPTIERLDARLGPGSGPGQARLEVEVEEARPYSAELRFANDESPSIGANKGELAFTWRSLLGRGDPLAMTVGLTEGLREVEAGYSVPLTPWDLRFRVEGRYSEADIVDDEVEDLDIESESRRITLGLSMPVIDTVANRVGLDLAFERERNRTFLLDEPFSFSPGADEGQTDLTLIRFTQDWLNRGRRRAIAAASTFTLGLDALGATDGDGEPDGQFLAWLGQAEIAHRVFSEEDQIAVRGTLQLTGDPLLASEQFTAGGLGSVRGYRVNEVVRDNGWTLSVEYRLPVLDRLVPDPAARPAGATLDLVPFFDAGAGWNHHRFREDSETLASVGLGLRAGIAPWLAAELYWGLPLIDREGSSDDRLQDAGIGFRLRLGLY